MTSRASRRPPSAQPARPASTSAPCEAGPASPARRASSGHRPSNSQMRKHPANPGNFALPRRTPGENPRLLMLARRETAGPANRDLRNVRSAAHAGLLAGHKCPPAPSQPARSPPAAHPVHGPARHPPSCAYLTPCLTERLPRASAQPRTVPAQRRPLPRLYPRFASVPPPGPRPALSASAFPADGKP
jgi:hypothetical protein